MKKILIIQTAFIGDVVLATSLVEKLHQQYPDCAISFLVRGGNQHLLEGHPFLKEVLVWNKGAHKLRNLFRLLQVIRLEKYDAVISAHRFASSGILTGFSKAKYRVGFKKNPFSFKFTHKVLHKIGNGKHEIERNQKLIEFLTDKNPAKPKLYPSKLAFEKAQSLSNGHQIICMAPASVWQTKQLPKSKWLDLIKRYNAEKIQIYLLGGPNDAAQNESLMAASSQGNVKNLAGELSFLESAALMQKATMNFVNDSGPLHFASAMNAPVTAFFCSTVPAFGFGPLSDQSRIVENMDDLACRPCGLHGFNKCPKGDFKCGNDIDISAIKL
ncbi:glycosyltransferase family 9 protein [Putridiphycobacter roseus]|uniref:Glycosyltransferase family 9 protein n=1 Tax=Putridiphycobacter roseus TaxID=2219161 RepID=A0A2W1NC77_9FLAO|nr:glycosyltransferase family 9 protein [Putridiphycobacter roseus]PZE15716.1 glycosyltransferase family 9 protein [Putridiphycobacter roseus]